MRFRTVTLLIIAIFFLWFLYIERTILTPFILAAIFAYLFNPVVNFFTKRMKIPRTLAVATIFILLFGSIMFSGYLLTKQLVAESRDLQHYLTSLLKQTQAELKTAPDFVQSIVNSSIKSVEHSQYLSSGYLLSSFPHAFSHLISLLIFLFAGFYFLREGGKIFDNFFMLLPKSHKVEVEILFRKINQVLGGYLRGQLILVAFVAVTLLIALSIVGVKFAYIIAIFSGFAEIVPILGPIVAGSVAVAVVLITGTTHFGLSPFQGAILVAVIYLAIRQFQDYFVTPYVMGKVTKLPSLVILFAALAGEHLMGLLGLVIAVPIAAALKLILEFCLDLAIEKDQDSGKGIE